MSSSDLKEAPEPKASAARERTKASDRKNPDGSPMRSSMVRGKKSKAKEDKAQVVSSLDMELQDSETEGDDHIGIYQNAELLMDQISDGSYTVGRLPVYQKKQIFYYLSVFHPLVSRVVNLHTKLPLSTLRLQKPTHDVDIVQDYIYSYFQNLMTDTNFRRELKKAVRYFWIFGEGVTLIEDDYEFLKDTAFDPELKGVSLPELDQASLAEVEEINNRYNTKPSTVTYVDKLKVLKTYLLSINKDYGGIINIRTIFPLDVKDSMFNSDVDYWVYSLERSHSLRNLIGSKSLGNETGEALLKKLKRLGYSEGYIRKNWEAESSYIEVDNDPFNLDGVYVARLATDENTGVDSSMLNSVLESAIQNLLAVRKSNTLVALASKIDRIVSAPKASIDQIDQLNDDLATMAENPEGSMLAVNFEVTVDTLSLDVKDNLDLSQTIERTNKEMLSTLGFPEDLVSEGGTYGSGFLKVELLTNEYVEFRNQLKDFIENQIFRPIAIKKGFFSHNEWGDLIPIYPSVRFDKFSLSRGSEDIAQLASLVSDGNLPVSILLEHLGFNVEDVEQRLLQESSSMFNKAIKDLLDTSIGDLKDNLIGNEEFLERIMSAVKLNLTGTKPPEDEDKK